MIRRVATFFPVEKEVEEKNKVIVRNNEGFISEPCKVLMVPIVLQDISGIFSPINPSHFIFGLVFWH